MLRRRRLKRSNSIYKLAGCCLLDATAEVLMRIGSWAVCIYIVTVRERRLPHCTIGSHCVQLK